MKQLLQKGLVKNPSKLGEHLRNRRLQLGLTQERLAVRLGTLREVYERWERDEREPVVSVWPAIISFLEYYPSQPVETPSALTLMARRGGGLDQKRMARKLGVIHQKVRGWERQTARPTEEQLRLLKEVSAAALRVAIHPSHHTPTTPQE